MTVAHDGHRDFGEKERSDFSNYSNVPVPVCHMKNGAGRAGAGIKKYVMESKKMSENKWLKITIATDPVLVESIGDYLVGVIEAGVETGARDEANYGIVTGYVQQANPDDDQVRSILGRVSSYLAELAKVFGVPVPVITSAMIAEEDWGTSWKQHFKPFEIVGGL
ncbi:MAG: hypothetical protein ACD_75C00316G0001, partial [uncultured bacterium]